MHHLIGQRRADIALIGRRYGVRQSEAFGSSIWWSEAQSGPPSSSRASPGARGRLRGLIWHYRVEIAQMAVSIRLSGSVAAAAPRGWPGQARP